MEKIVVRQSPAILVFKLIMAIVVTDLILFLASVISDLTLRNNNTLVANFMEYDTVILLIIIILQVIISLLILWDWYGHYYKIEDNQVIWHRGLILSRETIFVINQGMDLVAEQGYWEKILEYGNIRVKLNSKEQFVIMGISNPKYLLKILQDCQQRSGEGVR